MPCCDDETPWRADAGLPVWSKSIEQTMVSTLREALCSDDPRPCLGARPAAFCCRYRSWCSVSLGDGLLLRKARRASGKAGETCASLSGARTGRFMDLLPGTGTCLQKRDVSSASATKSLPATTTCALGYPPGKQWASDGSGCPAVTRAAICSCELLFTQADAGASSSCRYWRHR